MIRALSIPQYQSRDYKIPDWLAGLQALAMLSGVVTDIVGKRRESKEAQEKEGWQRGIAERQLAMQEQEAAMREQKRAFEYDPYAERFAGRSPRVSAVEVPGPEAEPRFEFGPTPGARTEWRPGRAVQEWEMAMREREARLTPQSVDVINEALKRIQLQKAMGLISEPLTEKEELELEHLRRRGEYEEREGYRPTVLQTPYQTGQMPTPEEEDRAAGAALKELAALNAESATQIQTWGALAKGQGDAATMAREQLGKMEWNIKMLEDRAAQFINAVDRATVTAAEPELDDLIAAGRTAEARALLLKTQQACRFPNARWYLEEVFGRRIKAAETMTGSPMEVTAPLRARAGYRPPGMIGSP